MVDAGIKQALQSQSAQAADASGMHQQVTQAIQLASAKTGVSFSYLLNKAQQESGGDPNAKSSASTATGLFQFTGQTWLRMMKSYGGKYGVGDYADQIKVDSDGVAHVKDAATKKAILALRKDPQLSAEMAGELDKENSATLKNTVGGKIGGTELYLAHFLGAGGASDFISTLRSDPNAKAADILPDAADANPTVFYDANGDARSVSQIYHHFAKKFDALPTSAPATTMMASATPTISAAAMSTAVTASKAAAAYASSTYVVADAAAAHSAYVLTSTKAGADSSSLLATMVMAQMKINDLPQMSLPAANGSTTKKNIASELPAVA